MYMYVYTASKLAQYKRETFTELYLGLSVILWLTIKCYTFFLQLLHPTNENQLDIAIGQMLGFGQYSVTSSHIQGEIMKATEIGHMMELFPHCRIF